MSPNDLGGIGYACERVPELPGALRLARHARRGRSWVKNPQTPTKMGGGGVLQGDMSFFAGHQYFPFDSEVVTSLCQHCLHNILLKHSSQKTFPLSFCWLPGQNGALDKLRRCPQNIEYISCRSTWNLQAFAAKRLLGCHSKNAIAKEHLIEGRHVNNVTKLPPKPG